MRSRLRTHVYVDGFNLYYGCLKDTPYKWLDLDRFCRILLPPNDILGIKYFTARIASRADDEGAPTRQETYLRAIRTIPNIEVVLGHVLLHVPGSVTIDQYRAVLLSRVTGTRIYHYLPQRWIPANRVSAGILIRQYFRYSPTPTKLEGDYKGPSTNS